MPTVVRVHRRRVQRGQQGGPQQGGRQGSNRKTWIVTVGAGMAAIAAIAAAAALRPSPPEYIPAAAAPPATAAAPTPSQLFALDAAASAETPMGAAAAGATSAAPAVAVPEADGPLIDNPTWTRTPSPEDMHRLYPPQAMGADGQAVVKCEIANGAPSNCSVISETPSNAGFGAAATQLAAGYGIGPTLADGGRTEGAQVTITINFHDGQDAQPQAAAPAPTAGVPTDAAPANVGQPPPTPGVP